MPEEIGKMHLVRLAARNIKSNGFRSLIIFLLVMGVVSVLISTTLIIQGINYSLDAGLKRLGADLLVVPMGAQSQIDTALLMGKPTKYTMPAQDLQKVEAISGVQAASSQIYLSSLYGAECCSFSETFLVVYDTATDLTISPWLTGKLKRVPAKNEVIGGSAVFGPNGSTSISLYGYQVTLAGNLEATGTGLDQTIFMTTETALEIAKSSVTTAAEPLVFSQNQVSAILVKVKPGADAHRVALETYKNIPDIAVIESPNLFGTYRHQITGLLWGFVSFIIIIWILAVLLVGMIFSLIAHQRRRELAVLRAMGATRNFILSTMLVEAGVLAFSGAVAGIAVSSGLLFMFKDFIVSSLKITFLFPDINSALLLFGIGLVVALITITLAVVIPAFRASRDEPAIAMRE